METSGVIPGQEIGSGFQKPVNPDGFVTIDVESFSPVFQKDFSSSSPRITLQRNVSRKGSPRSNNERKLNCDANGNDKETSFPQSPLRGSSTPEKPSTLGPTDHAGTSTTAATAVSSASPLHQITITTASTAAGNMISDQNRERRFGFTRKSSFKRSHSSWMLDPKKIVLFFATLSSMGSILLIIFTLSIKSNAGDMSLD